MWIVSRISSSLSSRLHWASTPAERIRSRLRIDTYHISQEEAARRIGKSQSAVANKLRLLKLYPEVLTILRDGGATDSPASRAARSRRSPATSSHWPSLRRTVRGWSTLFSILW